MSPKPLKPQIDPLAYIAPGASVMGDVRLAAKVSVWPGCVLRGDVNFIEVGESSNIQDLSVLHVTHELPCRVGAWVTVGHRVILHGCTIEDRCLIGMGAIVLDGAMIGEGSIVGAGCLVTEGMVVPPRSLVLGLPGKVVRTLDGEDDLGEALAREYLQIARDHRKGKYALYRPKKKDRKKK